MGGELRSVCHRQEIGGPEALPGPTEVTWIAWGRTSTCHCWAMAACHERPTRPTRKVPPPASLP